MDYNCFSQVFVLLIILFITVSFGEDPLKVRFEDATPVNASVHSEVDFVCHINRDVYFAFNNVINMIHIHPVTGKETVMSTAGSPSAAAPPSFYSITLKPNPATQEFMVVFNITDVTERDDGTYRCLITPKISTDEHGHADRKIVVYRPMDSLKLSIGDFDSFDKTQTEPLKLDAGEYKVGCVAEGSNPKADVSLDFHGVAIEGSTNDVALMDHEFRRYRTSSSATLNVMVSNRGQELSCQATDATGKSLTVKIAIDVNIYDATIMCNDTHAFVGQKNPILTCVVNYTNLEVTGFAFQVGDTGEIIREGQKNAQNMFVNVTKVEEGISIVALDLHKAKHEYLDKNYYVLIDIKGGHTSKESVRLNRVQAPRGMEIEDLGENDGPGGNGERVFPAVTLYFVMLLACLWAH